MNSRLGALLVAVAVAAAACGGGRLTAGEYYDQAGAAAATYDQATNDIFDQYQAAVADALAEFQTRTTDADTNTLIAETAVLRDTTIAEVTSAFEQAEAALDTFVATLSALEPPQAVQDAHDEAVTALTRSLDSIPELVAALNGAGSLSDIGTIINSSTFSDTQPRVTAACRELERVGSDLGVSADLHCGDSPAAGGSG